MDESSLKILKLTVSIFDHSDGAESTRPSVLRKDEGSGAWRLHREGPPAVAGQQAAKRLDGKAGTGFAAAAVARLASFVQPELRAKSGSI